MKRIQYTDIGYRHVIWYFQDECGLEKYELEVDDEDCLLHLDAETAIALDHTHHHVYRLSPELAYEVCEMISKGEIVPAFELALKEGAAIYKVDFEYGVKVNEMSE